MKATFYAAFDEGRGIVIGIVREQSKPIIWFEGIDEFDRFLSMLKQFRDTLPYIPDVFRKAFEEE